MCQYRGGDRLADPHSWNVRSQVSRQELLYALYATASHSFEGTADERSVWPSLTPDPELCNKIITTVADMLSCNGGKSFFLLLGLPSSVFDSLERRFCRDDPRRLNLECLMTWVRREARRASPQRLIDVLREEQIGREDIAKYIEEELKQSVELHVNV
jgi:hypothetical protein